MANTLASSHLYKVISLLTSLCSWTHQAFLCLSSILRKLEFSLKLLLTQILASSIKGYIKFVQTLENYSIIISTTTVHNFVSQRYKFGHKITCLIHRTYFRLFISLTPLTSFRQIKLP